MAVLAVLVVFLLAGLLLSSRAIAQGPEDATLLDQPPESAGYLHVHVYDRLTEQPLGNRVITIYNRSGEQVAQETTTCLGYVEFNALPGGPYRVLLEPNSNWTTSRRSNLPGGRNTPGEWVWVRPYWRVGVSFYESPAVAGAGLRVYAYLSTSRQANQPREPAPGAAFTVYDAGGTFVANGITGCGGFVDFNNLGGGQYRVVDANQPEGPYSYPPSGERWVTLQYGTVTSTWFFTVPSPGPETTPTP
ncbi:MAG: collagen binding domain-containing protein, partial [Anaerolineae bacterium]